MCLDDIEGTIQPVNMPLQDLQNVSPFSLAGEYRAGTADLSQKSERTTRATFWVLIVHPRSNQ